MPAVRNLGRLGPTGNVKPLPVIHFIPPAARFVYKIEIVTDTTTLDVTTKLVDGSFSDGVTSTIGDFNFTILDPKNTYSDQIEEFDTVKVYLDYGGTATTLKFLGKIERKSNNGYAYLELSGRSIAMITTETNVTYSTGGNMARSTILKNIIDQEFSSDITYTNIEDDLTEVNKTWEDVPFWSIVEELCTEAGYDAYIDVNQDMHYFAENGRKNTTEAVVEGRNMINPDDYAKDTEEIATQIRVVGQSIEGIPIIATSTNNTTNTKGIKKVLKINDENISTSDQASSYVEYEAANKLVAPQLGMVKSLLLPTISPGEMLRIVSPVNNIPPEYYEINSYTHTFSSSDSPQTSVEIKKRRLDIPTVFKKNIKKQDQIVNRVNPNNMDYSRVITFETDSGTHENTEINENYLKVSAGQTSGTWQSDTYSLSSNISKIEFRIEGENIVGDYQATSTNFFYSVDGGTTWNYLNLSQTSKTIVYPGKDIKIKLELNNSDTRVKAVAFLYSL